MDMSTAFEEHENGMKCGFLNVGKKKVKGFGVYNFDEMRNWEKCSCVPSERSGMRRVDPVSGTSITIAFEGQLTVDPNALGRQYGWYTSGDEEIIKHATYNKERGNALIFNDFTNDTARDEYMRNYVFTEDAHGVHGKTADVLTQTNSLECRILIRLRDADRFEEFQRPCSSVMAT
jgi:hypothetical protein